MNVRTACIAFLVALALVLAGCSANSTLTATVLGDGRPASKKPPTPVAMGQRAWSGNWAITIRSEKRTRSVRGAKAGKRSQLMLLHFEVGNGGTSGGHISVPSFALTDETGTELEAVLLPGSKYLSSDPVAVKAGTKRSFTIVYRIPKGGGPFVWRFWSSGQGPGSKSAVLAVR